MPDIIWHNATEISRLLNVHPSRVSRATKDGKLKGCFKTVKGKRRYDPDKTILAWKQNINPAKQKGGIATQEKHGKETVVSRETTKKLIEIDDLDHKMKIIREAGLGAVTQSDSCDIDSAFKAAERKLNYEKAKGKLVDADEFKGEIIRHLTAAKIKILGIKSKTAPLIIDFITDLDDRESVLNIIDSVAREVCNDLSEYGK